MIVPVVESILTQLGTASPAARVCTPPKAKEAPVGMPTKGCPSFWKVGDTCLLWPASTVVSASIGSYFLFYARSSTTVLEAVSPMKSLVAVMAMVVLPSSRSVANWDRSTENVPSAPVFTW